jgi:hypothetical protein
MVYQEYLSLIMPVRDEVALEWGHLLLPSEFRPPANARPEAMCLIKKGKNSKLATSNIYS